MASNSDPITAEFIILGVRKIRYSRPFAVEHLETGRDLERDFAYVARNVLMFYFLKHQERERNRIIGVRMDQGIDQGARTHSSYFCYDQKSIVDNNELEQPSPESFPFALTARFKKIVARLREAELTKALFVYPWSMGNPPINTPPPHAVSLVRGMSAISPLTGYLFFPNRGPAPDSWLARYRPLRNALL